MIFSGDEAIPSWDEYASALRASTVPAVQPFLQALYDAGTISVRDFAVKLGFSAYQQVNVVYGTIGRDIGEYLEYLPCPPHLVSSIVTFEHPTKDVHWRMRPELMLALEHLGWIENIRDWEHVQATRNGFLEGQQAQILVNRFERSSAARAICLRHYGLDCVVCGFNFGKVFGEFAEGYIQVHHLSPLSEIREAYQVDPVRDLRPVCANCHAAIHLTNPPLTIDEAQAVLGGGANGPARASYSKSPCRQRLARPDKWPKR